MATKIYKIYKCTNNVNGKVYIGYTHKSLDKRIIEFGFSLPPEKKIFNMNQKIILQDLLKKKNPKFNFQQEKKGLFFNLKNWQNQKDRFRNKYFSTIEKSWLTNN